MGVWCDSVRNQFGENGCDTDLQAARPKQRKEFRWIAVTMACSSSLQSSDG
jgi:hypothetical protein